MEVWKDIENYKGIYQVSNYGNVKSLNRVIDRNVVGKLPISERILSAYNVEGMYPMVSLCKDKKVDKIHVHRLVIEAFILNPENKRCTNHKDGNKLNNHVSNLEWCTHSENILHAYNVLKCKRPKGREGKDNHESKMVLNSETGIYYESAREACNTTSYKYRTFRAWLFGQMPNKTNFKYV